MRLAILYLWGVEAMLAACLSFTPPPGGSRCAAQAGELHWVSPPARLEVERRAGRPHYDRTLADPAFQAGAKVRGRVELDWRAPGRHFLEVFVMNPEADRFPFRLTANGRTLDERPPIAPGPGRMRPKRGLRYTSLLAMVDGPARLAIESEAPWYALSAARWTPAREFESDTVPRLLERARFLETHILLEADGERPMSRRHYLQHLGDRLVFSTRPEVRKAGLLDRVRAWYWLAMENHEPDDILQTHLLFEEALKVMPDSSVLRQTVSASCLGQVVSKSAQGDYCRSVAPTPWQVDVPPPPPGAPAWAVEQRKLIRRFDALTRWWVEKRQAPNGELGGEWGDDVEILRYWGPQALGFGSAVAARGVLNQARGIWQSETLLDGYNKGVTDVEHSSEPTTDTQPLAAALEPESADALRRLAATTACSDSWLARQPDGQLRFRSSWFNCREADTSAARAVDVHLNVRAMGPALWHAYLTRDPKLIERIAQWADSWIRAMRSTAGGKPAGVFPSVLRSADGGYLIGSARWDKPEAEWDYFQWSGGSQEAIASLVLAAYELTGDRKYLDAATAGFLPMLACQGHPDVCQAMRAAPGAFYAWRQISGDARFDSAFGFRPEPPDAEALAAMARMASETEKKHSVNWDIMTGEVLYTDRVYYPLPAEYRWMLFGGEAPRGDRYPTFAVTWPVADAEFARAVLAASDSLARFRLYSFDTVERSVPVRFWKLKPGTYQWTAGRRKGAFTVTRLPHTERFPLAPRQETSLEISRLP